MRKTLIPVTLIGAAMVGTGFVSGQLHGSAAALAASRHATGRASGTPTVSRTPRPVTPHADGTVTAVNGNTITVTPDDDTNAVNEYTKVTTIVLTDTTAFKGSTTRASIVVGASITAEGTLSADETTLTATSVGIGGHGGPGGGHRGGPHADGAIVSISGNTVTVQPDADTNETDEYTKVTTVLLTDSTTYGRNQTRASIVAGAAFIAEGTLSSDGTTLTATRFTVRLPRAAPVATATAGS